MTVADIPRYQRHRMERTTGSWTQRALHELGLPMLLLGSMGAITWAIRGTGGWDGIEGTVLPGITWGLLWFYLCHRKGIDARGIVLWLGLGIALGGELGYGQYVSWIRGQFQVGDGIIPISPWVGYVWFVICGIGWAAPGGIFLGWALSRKVSWERWLCRLLIPLGVAYLGVLLTRVCPWLFFPNHGLGIYEGVLCSNLERTVYTNTQNFGVVAWWLGALVVAAVHRDRSTLVVGALLGLGFGFGFMQSAVWRLGYTHASGYIDWWKMWELNAGFNLGLCYVLALYWAIRQVDKTQLGGGVLGIAPDAPPGAAGRWRGLSLIVATSWMAIVMSYGMTYGLGILFKVYEMASVNQYAWPRARVILYAPIGAVILCTVLYKIIRQLRDPERLGFDAARLPQRMTNLMAITTAVGVITILEMRIAALYALFLCLALFAFGRLNYRFDEIDNSPAHMD